MRQMQCTKRSCYPKKSLYYTCKSFFPLPIAIGMNYVGSIMNIIFEVKLLLNQTGVFKLIAIQQQQKYHSFAFKAFCIDEPWYGFILGKQTIGIPANFFLNDLRIPINETCSLENWSHYPIVLPCPPPPPPPPLPLFHLFFLLLFSADC